MNSIDPTPSLPAETAQLKPRWIPTSRMAEFKIRIAELNRRAKRLGLAETTYQEVERQVRVMEVFVEGEYGPEARPRRIHCTAVVVNGPVVNINGWTCVGTVEPVADSGNQNLIRAFVDLPERFRTVTLDCDHCHTNRQRQRIFILRSISNPQEFRQVGSGCVGLFTKAAEGVDIAAAMDFLSFLDHEVDGFGSCAFGAALGHPDIDAHLVAAYTLSVIAVHGYMSKAAAEAENRQSTRDLVTCMIFQPSKVKGCPSEGEIIEKHGKTAEEIVAYWRDHEGRSDFDHNCRAVFSADFVPARSWGFVCGGVSAYLREQERRMLRAQELPSEHLGQPKERLRDLTVLWVSSRLIGSTDYGDRHLHTFRTERGDIVKWFTDSASVKWGSGAYLTDEEKKLPMLLDGTVKKHDVWQDRKETVLSRVVLGKKTESSVAKKKTGRQASKKEAV